MGGVRKEACPSLLQSGIAKSETLVSQTPTFNSGLGTSDLGPGTWDFGFRTRDLHTLNLNKIKSPSCTT